jgi:hypothetical protein
MPEELRPNVRITSGGTQDLEKCVQPVRFLNHFFVRFQAWSAQRRRLVLPGCALALPHATQSP